MPKKIISEQLRAAILKAGVSRFQIAKDTGVSESVLSRFVNGSRSIDITTADRIASYLKLELMHRQEN